MEQCDLSFDHLTVFGDNLNDLPMFEYAARSIAVDNAKPELKTQADLTIGPNADDSVASFISKEYSAP